MRHLPTWGLAAALVLGGAAWLGCTADGAAPLAEDADGTEPSTRGASSSSGSGNTPSDRPDFQAEFPDAGPDQPGNDAGGSTPATCVDKDDPGGAEGVAKPLAATDDCDDSMKSVKGIANGPIDVDFYKLSAQDKFLCSLDTEFNSPTAGLELCVFARCGNSTANAVSGCKSGTLKTAAGGIKGCCAATPGKATPEWDCSGITDNDSAEFYISVKQAGGNECLPYTLNYRY